MSTFESRVRGVNAPALQERVTAPDLADPDTLAAIAAAARFTPEQAAERYAPR